MAIEALAAFFLAGDAAYKLKSNDPVVIVPVAVPRSRVADIEAAARGMRKAAEATED